MIDIFWLLVLYTNQQISPSSSGRAILLSSVYNIYTETRKKMDNKGHEAFPKYTKGVQRTMSDTLVTRHTLWYKVRLSSF